MLAALLVLLTACGGPRVDGTYAIVENDPGVCGADADVVDTELRVVHTCLDGDDDTVCTSGEVSVSSETPVPWTIRCASTFDGEVLLLTCGDVSPPLYGHLDPAERELVLDFEECGFLRAAWMRDLDRSRGPLIGSW